MRLHGNRRCDMLLLSFVDVNECFRGTHERPSWTIFYEATSTCIALLVQSHSQWQRERMVGSRSMHVCECVWLYACMYVCMCVRESVNVCIVNDTLSPRADSKVQCTLYIVASITRLCVRVILHEIYFCCIHSNARCITFVLWCIREDLFPNRPVF